MAKALELSVFIQINTDEDIDKWMAPDDCDLRPQYSLEDIKGAYWEVIPEAVTYFPAIKAGAKTMTDLFMENPDANFIFIFGSPTRLCLESFGSYIAEMGGEDCWEDYFETEEDYEDICGIEDDDWE